MTIAQRAIEIIKSCRNEQQTEVATRFVELLIKSKSPALSQQEKNELLQAIDQRLTDLQHELRTKQRLAFV